MNCPACHRKKTTNIGVKNDYQLKKCDNCGTIFVTTSLNNDKTTKEVQDLYNHYYDFANYTLLKATEISLQKMVDTFEPFRKTGNLVDIGFGEGGMLSVVEKNGWKCFGTELSPHSLKYGKERGWIVSNDALSDENFPKGEFDVVTMVELIEHVPNPDYFLDTAYKLLRPGGLLFLTTPNTNSLNRRWLGTDWSVIAPPEHTTIWSSLGLKSALGRNGFSLQNIRTEGFNPIEIINKYRSPSKETGVSVNRNQAGFALNEALTSSPWRQSVKSILNQGLSSLKIGDGIKLWAVKK